MLAKLRKDERGFTLIEMMVVLAVIALLAALIVPSIGRALQNSRVQAVQNQARAIQAAMEQYFYDEGDYPPEDSDPLIVKATGPDQYKQGPLYRYVSFSDKDLAFEEFSYTVDNSNNSYEIVLETKDVSIDRRFVRITPNEITVTEEPNGNG